MPRYSDEGGQQVSLSQPGGNSESRCIFNQSQIESGILGMLDFLLEALSCCLPSGQCYYLARSPLDIHKHLDEVD